MGYTVYYNTSYDEAGKYEAVRINRTVLRNTARIPLRPWTSYTFHVTSENNVGTSERSEFTHSDCTTPQARPYRNPHRVCTESRDPDSLVIIWEVRMTSSTSWSFIHIPSYIHTYVRTYVRTYIPTYIHAYPHTYTHTMLFY